MYTQPDLLSLLYKRKELKAAMNDDTLDEWGLYCLHLMSVHPTASKYIWFGGKESLLYAWI